MSTSAETLEKIGGARLILTMQRLGRLGVERDGPGLIALQKIDIERITALILDEDARIDAPVSNPVPAEEAALDLLRLAHLLPAAILIKLEAAGRGAQRGRRLPTSAPFARAKLRRCG